MRPAAIALASLATLALAWGLAAGTAAPIAWHDTDASALRLSWSVHPERIETCRERTAAELAERPVHMRQALECAGNAATYLLEVRVDGVLIDSAVVRGSGFRGDRPIFLLRDYPVPPGAHRVRVSFTRREPSEQRDEGDEEDDDASPARGNAGTVAPHLTLEAAVGFDAGSVALVTIRDGALVLRTRAATIPSSG